MEKIDKMPADGSEEEVQPIRWVEFRDNDGDPYYYRPDTQETTRKKPHGPNILLVSEEQYMAEHDGDAASTASSGVDDWVEYAADEGEKYYYSASRNESRWQKPTKKLPSSPTAAAVNDNVMAGELQAAKDAMKTLEDERVRDKAEILSLQTRLTDALAAAHDIMRERDTLIAKLEDMKKHNEHTDLRNQELQKRAEDAEMKLTAAMKASASSAAAAAALKRGVARQDSTGSLAPAQHQHQIMQTASRIAGWKANADASEDTAGGVKQPPTPTARGPASITLSQLSFLKSVPLFHSFSEDKFMRLATKFQKVHFSPGDIILRQGAPPDGFFYVIESGKVAVHVRAGPVKASGNRSRAPSGMLTGDASPTSTSMRPMSMSVSLRRVDSGSSTAELSMSPGSARGRNASLSGFTVDGTPLSSPSASSTMAQTSPLHIGSARRGTGRVDSDPPAMEEGTGSDDEESSLNQSFGPVVAELSKGMFFGERALMTSEPRAATCIATTGVITYALDRRAFEEVLSSVSDFLGDYSRQNYCQETPETICLARYVHCFKGMLEHAGAAAATNHPDSSEAAVDRRATEAAIHMMSLISPESSVAEVVDRLQQSAKTTLDVEYAEVFLVDTAGDSLLIAAPVGRPGILDGTRAIDLSTSAFLTMELLEDSKAALAELKGVSLNNGFVRVPMCNLGAYQAIVSKKGHLVSNNIRNDERFLAEVDGDSWLSKQRLLDRLLCFPDKTSSMAASVALDGEGATLAVVFVANKMSSRSNSTVVETKIGATGEEIKPYKRSKSIMDAPTGTFDDQDEDLLLCASDTLSIALSDKKVELEMLLSTESFCPLASLSEYFSVTVGALSGLPMPGVKASKSSDPKQVDRAAARAADKAASALQKGKVLGAVTVAVSLYHGSQIMTEARTECSPLLVSPDGQGTTTAAWNMAVPTTLQYSSLPFATRVIFNVLSRDGAALGWAGFSVFTSQQVLLTGDITLKLWPGNVTSDTIMRVTNLSNSLGDASTPQLTISLPKFAKTVVRMNSNFSSTASLRSLSQSGSQSDVLADRATPTEFAALQKLVLKIVNQDPLYDMTAEEVSLVWRCREYICNNPMALPKFLHAVRWADASCVNEAHRMLRKWRAPSPEQSLELLQADFPDPTVRAYAVEKLEKLGDDALRVYMLQLTQVLKFETFLDSSLTRFLLRRALLSPRKVGHVLFWFLKAEMHIPEVAQRFGAILQQYLLNCRDHRTALGHQMFVMAKLEDIARKVKAAGSKEERLTMLRTELPRIVFPERFQLPLSPDMVAKSIVVEKCRVMSSKKLPLWLVFEAATELDGLEASGIRKTVSVLFKAGDDLRQDQLTLQILGIMNSLWKHESFDLRMSPYLCVSTGDELGMIEVVLNANTLANIVAEAATAEGGSGWSRKFNAAMKVFSKDMVYKEWLLAQNAARWEDIEDNFIRSCAGYCVATYVLGIGDRHNDNLMLTKDGKLFHIDFGHFLGNFKSKFGYKRERAPFVFTPGFAAVMGGEGSDGYRRFESLACAAYNILRRHGHLLITLFYLMLASGLPELETPKDMDWLREKLMLGATDEEAAEHFRRQIKASLNTKATLINDAVHLLAHA